MKRYFLCSKKKKDNPEFIEGTPVEILSPLSKQLQSLPTKKEELELLDYELIEQLHLLEAEYNKRFQEAKHCIAKDDMLRGVHHLSRSNELKLRMIELEKQHSEIQTALDTIRLPIPIPIQIPIQPLRIRIPK